MEGIVAGGEVARNGRWNVDTRLHTMRIYSEKLKEAMIESSKLRRALRSKG